MYEAYRKEPDRDDGMMLATCVDIWKNEIFADVVSNDTSSYGNEGASRETTYKSYFLFVFWFESGLLFFNDQTGFSFGFVTCEPT